MQKEHIQLLKEVYYQLYHKNCPQTALVLLQYVLNQYFDTEFNIISKLELKVVYPALHFYNQCADLIKEQSDGINLQIVRHRLNQYISKLNMQPSQLTEDYAKTVFFHIDESDKPMREFNDSLSDMLEQQTIEVDQLTLMLNQFIDVQRLYQHDKRYSAQLLQQQYVLQALKFLQYYLQGKGDAMERVRGHLGRLHDIFTTKNIPLCYNIFKMSEVVRRLAARQRAPEEAPQSDKVLINLFLVRDTRVLCGGQGDCGGENGAVQLWLRGAA